MGHVSMMFPDVTAGSRVSPECCDISDINNHLCLQVMPGAIAADASNAVSQGILLETVQTAEREGQSHKVRPFDQTGQHGPCRAQ